jgi:hypothetical protein
MALYILLFVGLLGWAMVFAIIFRTCSIRKQELLVIEEIKSLITEFKQEIKKLK